MVLTFVPVLVAVTLTANVHDALPASVAPDRLMLPLPGVAVMVPPPHEPLEPLGVATTRPAGRVSLKPTPLRELEPLGLLTVKESEVLAPTLIEAAPNDLLIDGGLGVVTVMVEVAVLPFPPSLDATALVVLTWVPVLVAVTLTANVHDALPPASPPTG